MAEEKPDWFKSTHHNKVNKDSKEAEKMSSKEMLEHLYGTKENFPSTEEGKEAVRKFIAKDALAFLHKKERTKDKRWK